MAWVRPRDCYSSNHMDVSTVGTTIWRLFVRYLQWFVGLPAIFIFGLLIMFAYVALIGTLNEAAIKVGAIFIKYFVSLPMHTTIDPAHISLDIHQMNTLFLTWGTGLPVQNVIELVIGFIVVAAVSLGISYLLSRYDESLAPKDQGIKN